MRSFADSNDDGIGDLPGITSHLEYVKNLGADAVWLTPFYPSPQKDHGYDVANYDDVQSEYGTLEDFDLLVQRAHDLRMKVLVDLVPNHTSDSIRGSRQLSPRRTTPFAPVTTLRMESPTARLRTTGSPGSAARPGPRKNPAGSGTCISSLPSSLTSTGRTPTSPPSSSGS